MKSRIMFFGLLAMALQTGCATSTLPESVCLAQEESISDCGPAGYGGAGESDGRRRDAARSGEGGPPEGAPDLRIGDCRFQTETPCRNVRTNPPAKRLYWWSPPQRSTTAPCLLGGGVVRSPWRGHEAGRQHASQGDATATQRCCVEAI